MLARPLACLLLAALAACGGGSDASGTGGATTTSNTTSSTSTGSGGHGTGGAGGSQAGAGGVATGGSGGVPCAGVSPARTVVSVDDLYQMMQQKDFALINVHVPDEGEIVGTDIHIPYTDVDGLETYLGHTLDAKAVLYCFGGAMSVAAGDELVARGYCRIYDLAGGLAAWKLAGYPWTPP
ncbi:MAG: rhodanese-like domain-containing protein [Polyangiaceae bacterium]|nr:rhodanese-like domain-containing protein [Polyangiaceae bacterium]